MSEDTFEVVPDGRVKDRLGRVKLGREAREALIVRFLGGGMSQAKFCRREGINATTFSGWLRDRRKRGAHMTRAGETTSTLTRRGSHAGESTHSLIRSESKPEVFREVAVTGAKVELKAPVVRLTVTLPGGVKVEGCDAATAVELARLMKGGL